MKWLLLGLLVSCVNSSSVTCGDIICPGNQACDPAHMRCVFPDQLTTCVGKADGVECKIESTTSGLCEDMVCVEPVCNDNVVEPGELCDHSTPEIGTCVDYNYDYGRLGCSNLCGASFDKCKRLGWELGVLPGNGPIYDLASDGEDMWAFGLNGVWHRIAGVWSTIDGAPQNLSHGWAKDGFLVVGGAVSNVPYIEFYDGSWHPQTLPVGGVDVERIWGRARDDLFVATSTTVFHFDGSAWTTLDTFDTNAPTFAYTITGTAASTYLGSDRGIFRLEGTTWKSLFSSPGVFRGLYVSDDDKTIMTVDSAFSWVSKDSGVSFSAVATPKAISTFRAIAGRSATEVYAVSEGSGTNLHRFDGSRWSEMDAPNGTNGYNAIAIDGDRVLAAASAGTVVSYTGVGWALVPASSSQGIQALWGDSTGFTSSLGGGCPEDLQSYGWDAPVGLSCCAGASALFGTGAADLWAISSSNIVRRTTSGWACFATTPSGIGQLYGGWSSTTTDAYAVGTTTSGAAYAMHWNGSAWTTLDLPTPHPLHGIWGTSSTDVFAVGEQGTIVHFDGTAWSAMTSATAMTLQRVWGTAHDNVYAVGAHGTIVHYDGTSWTTMSFPAGTTVPTESDLLDVHGTGPADIYAVGGRLMLRFDGTEWAPLRRPATADLAAVFALPGHVQVGDAIGARWELVGLH